GVLHASIGKVSFNEEQLCQNIVSLFDTVIRAKPQTAKGVYLQKASLSLTQSPGVCLDVNSVQSALRES
ncbi:MAG: 50S ribosomal protein L1, partial [Myxococcota bacterium]